jgi:hypothetical protein
MCFRNGMKRMHLRQQINDGPGFDAEHLC